MVREGKGVAGSVRGFPRMEGLVFRSLLSALKTANESAIGRM